MKKFTSVVSKKEFSETESVHLSSVNPLILKLISKDHPDINLKGKIAMQELNEYRQKFITQSLEKELGQLSVLEKTVLDNLSNKKLLTPELDGGDAGGRDTIGQKVADKVASFGGSWTFIILFCGFLVLWIIYNYYLLHNKGFDPYPFILLNLLLSCIAALQAPVIMMSQNRQEEKDRERARKDYMINLKSELEIRMLHEKMDHMIMHQQQELLDIQKVQIEMMDDIISNIKKEKK